MYKIPLAQQPSRLRRRWLCRCREGKKNCSHMKYLIYYLHYLRSSFLLLCLPTCHNHIRYVLITAPSSHVRLFGCQVRAYGGGMQQIDTPKNGFSTCETQFGRVVFAGACPLIEANKLNSNERTKFQLKTNLCHCQRFFLRIVWTFSIPTVHDADTVRICCVCIRHTAHNTSQQQADNNKFQISEKFFFFRFV